MSSAKSVRFSGTAGRRNDPVVVSAVSKSYGSFKAVNNVSLTLSKGEIFGLLGPNGAGKTTLIECIEGIRTPDGGTISILGLDYRQGKKQIKERIGVQLQTTGFYEELTVKELLKLYASFYSRHLNIDELLEKLNLQDKKKTLVKGLSGGMYQRLSLGVALINDPEIIFLDEPTTGLDPNARRIIWDIVNEAREKGKTIFLTTHYMEEAEFLCSRVAIMDKGEIISLNSPEELIKKHIGEKAMEIEFVDFIDLETIKNIACVEKFWHEGKKLTLTTVDVQKTMASLFKLPDQIGDLKLRQGNLEDVFLKLTNRGLNA